MKDVDLLKIDTREGKLTLNGQELKNVRNISIHLHDDDRTTVTISLSPCEVDTHIGIDKNNRNDWLGGT